MICVLINEHSIKAYKELAERCVLAYYELVQSTQQVKNSMALHQEEMMQNKAQFDKCISRIEENLSEMAEPLLTISGYLYAIAEAYIEIWNNDRFSRKE